MLCVYPENSRISMPMTLSTEATAPDALLTTTFTGSRKYFTGLRKTPASLEVQFLLFVSAFDCAGRYPGV